MQYRSLTVDELVRRVPRSLSKASLRDLILDYPLRPGKGLRPALCLSTCEAFGGRREEALSSAVAIELFHNAALIHDDVEDGSALRRGLPTLHARYGIPQAINAGDAMYVLTLGAVLDNLDTLGPAKTYLIFQEIEFMVLQSVEGQSLELGWIERGDWDVQEKDYFLMCLKKTGWYTCITPCRVGALIAGAGTATANIFNSFGYHLGIAFQIQDDILNLQGEQRLYGKEAAGDLREGKRTLILIHLLSHASRHERRRLVAILNRPRAEKQAEEMAWVMELIEQYGSIPYARAAAWRFARRASEILDRQLRSVPESEAKAFLRAMVDYVVNREL